MKPPDDILAAAERILAADGADALTMDRLAHETGLSRATLYRQVGTREALLDALATRGAEVGERGDTRERILTAAREIFGRAGFDAATVEEVATAAGVGVASVYRHFRDKDGLIEAFVENLQPRRVARAASVATNDVRADLLAFAEGMLEAARTDAPVMRLVMSESLRGGNAVARIRKASPMRSTTAVTTMLRTHIEAGRLRPGDPAAMAQALTGMIFAFGFLGPVLRGEAVPDARATAAVIVDLFLHGAAIPRRTR